MNTQSFFLTLPVIISPFALERIDGVGGVVWGVEGGGGWWEEVQK